MGLRNQLCRPAQKLRLTPLGTLRWNHQQATLMPESPCRPKEESPTMLTTVEAEADYPQNPEGTPAGNPYAGLPFRAEESPTMLTAAEALNFNHFKTNLHYLFL